MIAPQEIVASVVKRLYPDSVEGWLGGDDTLAGRIDKHNAEGDIDGEMILGLMAEAIEADRAQRGFAVYNPDLGEFVGLTDGVQLTSDRKAAERVAASLNEGMKEQYRHYNVVAVWTS